MKKAVLFALIALLGGLALGTLFGSGISSASLNSVRATAAEYPAVSALDAIDVEGRSTLYLNFFQRGNSGILLCGCFFYISSTLLD